MLELAILVVGATLAAGLIFLPNAVQAWKRQKRRTSTRAAPTAPALRAKKVAPTDEL